MITISCSNENDISNAPQKQDIFEYQTLRLQQRNI